MTHFDPTAIDIAVDPQRQRMHGVAVHGNREFDVPFVSHIDGNLWTGGCKTGLVLPNVIDHVISLYPWEAYTHARLVKSSHAFVMYDAQGAPDRSTLDMIAEIGAWCLRSGPTLFHCQAGLNRSSLCAAYTLITKFGVEPQRAIELIRSRRSSSALCNRSFYEFLLHVKPVAVHLGPFS